MKTRPRPIRLIVTDLDGTFLGSDGTASPENCAAVARAAEIGVPTVFATGRPARRLLALEPVRSARSLAIVSNGALVIDLATQASIHVFPLDTAVIAEVFQDVRSALPQAVFALEYVMGFGREECYPLFYGSDDATVVAPCAEALLDAGVPVKLLIRAGLPTQDLWARVAPVIGDRLYATFSFVSESGFLELTRLGVSKASTLRILLDEMGIAADDVVAFGDMPNDLPMLDLVGHPFIMDNAHESLKRRGYPMCGHHDDSAFATTVQALLGL